MAQELGGSVERTGVSEFGKTAVRVGGALGGGPARGADGVDEPPRLGRRASRGRNRDRVLAGRADRGLRGPGAAALRRAVPPGGRAHAARAGSAEELPLRGGRRAADLDGRGGDRGAGRADPRAGRLGARPVRALGRRRLGGRRAARAQGGRRPARLRLRRPRPAPEERGRAGGRDLRGALPRAARPRLRRGAVPRTARGRLRPRGEAQGDRRGVHPRLRRGVDAARRRSATSSRERSTPT